MIISRYLFREILNTLLAIALLLIMIYISHRFMKYLVQASVGDLPAEFIFQLLALRLLSDLMLILPLAFFLALLLSLGRLYKDNEVTAMVACGIPLPFKSIIGFGVSFGFIIALLSLVLAPWAEEKRAILQVQLTTSAEMGGIAAGRFKEFSHGNGIFYIEELDTDSKLMKRLFVQVNLDKKRVVMIAKRGYQLVEDGELFLVLIDGNRYESEIGKLNYLITNFAEHRIRIPKRLDAIPKTARIEAMPSYLLFLSEKKELQAELQWRLSLPLSVILLAALAVPLSHTTPRQGQYSKIVLGILIYLIYNNLLNVAKKWVERGDVANWVGVWWVHLVLLLIIIILFNYSHIKNAIRALLKPLIYKKP